MPPVIAAVTAIAQAGFWSTWLGKMVVGMVISTAISFVTTKKLKQPQFGGVDRTSSVRQPITFWRRIYGRTRTGGAVTFLHTTDNHRYMHMLITLASHEIEEVESVYFNDQAVVWDPITGAITEGDFAGRAWIWVGLGTTAGDADLHAALTDAAPAEWTSAHRQDGHAKLYVMLEWSPDVYPSGTPQISAILKGAKVYDPRTQTTAWSENVSLCLADYMTATEAGLGVNYGVEMGEASLIAAANVCDEEVALEAGGTEARYSISAVVDGQDSHRENISAMLGAMAGTAIYSGGRWVIKAAAWDLPIITLDESDLAGPIQVTTMLSRRELFNGVKGVFNAAKDNYVSTEFPSIQSAVFVAEDEGEEIWQDMDLHMVSSGTQAQRIAKIALLKARQQISVNITCHLSALKIRCGDVVKLTNNQFGWDEKPFEVTSWELMQGGSGDAPLLLVNLSLRETASSDYNWSTSEEQVVDPAPNTNLPSAWSLSAPTNMVLASGGDHLLIAGDGSVLSRILATWQASSSPFVVKHEIRWKKSTEISWSSTVVGGGDLKGYVGPVDDGISYDIQVRAIAHSGARSDWVSEYSHTVQGKTTPPTAPPSGFAITEDADGTRRFSWSADDQDADVRAGGGYKIRFASGSNSIWSNMDPLHEGVLTMAPYETNSLAAGLYTFAIKSIDSSGNESDDASWINGASMGDPRIGEALIYRREQDYGWPGSQTNAYADSDGHLHAAGTETWDDLPDSWDALSNSWDEIVESHNTIEYITPVLDVGQDLNFRPLVSAQCDGTETVTMQVGTEMEGAPVGAFVSPDVVEARYIKIKIAVTGTAPDIKSLVTILDAPSKKETWEDLNTSSGTNGLYAKVATGHFKIATRGGLASITQAQISAIQGVGAGWSWVLVSKSALVGSAIAAEFKLYDSTGTLADATVDVLLRGPKAES
ncbi:phage tail protein [Magnetococcus sp. PR-3]|uniref:phage tail protein n=1 Tax=Magnetococcus sp. PR-3 TaxID=3120355 RepID=UPI002FCE1EBC